MRRFGIAAGGADGVGHGRQRAANPRCAGVSAEPTTTFVEAGRLLADPSNGVVQRDKTLVIRGNQVVEVRDGFVGDASQGKVVDLRRAFVLPGLIDSTSI